MLNDFLLAADVSHIQCGIQHAKHWPPELRNEQITWLSNENLERTGPVYRIITEDDVRTVEAGERYTSESHI